MQGYHLKSYDPYYSFIQGGFNYVYGKKIFAQGLSIYSTNIWARDSFIQGTDIDFANQTHYGVLVQGRHIDFSNFTEYSIFQGRGHTINALCRGVAVFGNSHIEFAIYTS